jgi:coenzyme F420-reducing hydrogenase delta subunit
MRTGKRVARDDCTGIIRSQQLVQAMSNGKDCCGSHEDAGAVRRGNYKALSSFESHQSADPVELVA